MTQKYSAPVEYNVKHNIAVLISSVGSGKSFLFTRTRMRTEFNFQISLAPRATRMFLVKKTVEQQRRVVVSVKECVSVCVFAVGRFAESGFRYSVCFSSVERTLETTTLRASLYVYT